MSESVVAIIGAGPAGLRAAATLVQAGIQPVLITEAPAVGGQIYRQPPTNFQRPASKLYGTEAHKALRLFTEFEGIRNRIDFRPETLVWNIFRDELHLIQGEKHGKLAFDRLILCTGATDRIAAIPGWTMPGIYSLGGAQIALKAQGLSIGRRVVFVGTGPLLYLAATQYVAAGVNVAAVLDTTPFWTTASQALGLLSEPGLLMRGIGFIASLRRAGVKVLNGVTPICFEGTDGVTGIRFLHKGKEHLIECDAATLGFGLRSETQLADLAECKFGFDDVMRQWLPETDIAGRTSQPGVYLAGDGARIGGADTAELAGERAALAVLEDLGRKRTARANILDRKLASIRVFRDALERAYPYPAALPRDARDETIICRCEGITAKEIRRSAEALGAREMNRSKAFVRLGMGRCQGRMCGSSGAEILASASNTELRTVGRIRGQQPVKPIPVVEVEGFLEAKT